MFCIRCSTVYSRYARARSLHDVVLVFSERLCVSAYGGGRRTRLTFCELQPGSTIGCSHSFCSPSLFSWLNGCASTLLYGSAVAVPFMKLIWRNGKKLMLERYVLLEVTNRLHLLLSQRMKWLPKTFSTPPRAGHTVMCITYRPKSSGEGTITAPSWKYHGAQEDDVSWRSQGAQDDPHRDKSSLPNLRGRQLVSLFTGTQQGDTSWGSLRARPSPKTRSFHFLHPKPIWRASQKDCFAVSLQRMRKMYEMGLRLGLRLTLRPFSIVMWLIQKVFILLTARHQPESILSRPLVSTSTTYDTAQSFS